MARPAEVTPSSPLHTRKRSRDKLQANRDRQQEEKEEEERKSQILRTRKARTIKRIEEDLGFDLTELFSCWPPSLEIHNLGLNTLAVVEELLRIFSRYQRLDDRQIRQQLVEAVPEGKKPTFGPLNKLLRRVQAVPESRRHLPSPRSICSRRETGSDTDSESDAEERSEVSEIFEEQESEEGDEEDSVELGRGVSEEVPGRLSHSSDDLNEDDLSVEDSIESSRNQIEDESNFLSNDRHHPLPNTQTNIPQDEHYLLFEDLLEPDQDQQKDESSVLFNNRHHPPPDEPSNLSQDDCNSPAPNDQNGSPSRNQSDLNLGNNRFDLQRPGLHSPARRAKDIQSRMANSAAQRREKATDPKDASTEELNHHRERSTQRTSRPPGEDKTRAGLQAALADAKSKHYDAEQEVQKWQASCVKLCEVVDRAERKLAASRSTRLETQDLRDCTPESLRHKVKMASARQEKRAKHHHLLMQVTKRQERQLEIMLKARERSMRTQGIIKRIEALLQDISGADTSDAVVESCEDDDDVDSLMAGLDDDDPSSLNGDL